MRSNGIKRNQALLIMICGGLALTAIAGEPLEEPVMENATVSGGGVVMESGAVMLTGQTIVGTTSSAEYSLSAGFVYVVETTSCPADLDGDGTVGVTDLLQVLAAWGPCVDCSSCPADLDGDCEVGVTDLLMQLAAWGPCP